MPSGSIFPQGSWESGIGVPTLVRQSTFPLCASREYSELFSVATRTWPPMTSGSAYTEPSRCTFHASVDRAFPPRNRRENCRDDRWSSRHSLNLALLELSLPPGVVDSAALKLQTTCVSASSLRAVCSK